VGGVALHEVGHKAAAVVGSLVEALAGTIGAVPDETLTRLRKKSLQSLLIPRYLKASMNPVTNEWTSPVVQPPVAGEDCDALLVAGGGPDPATDPCCIEEDLGRAARCRRGTRPGYGPMLD